MNRQSGSQAPIPVTPKDASSFSQVVLPLGHQQQLTTTPAPSTKRKSREGRLSWLAQGRIWRPSTSHSPHTPQWPLPRNPLSIQDANPAFTRTYTRPRDAPLPPPPPPASSNSSATTLTTALHRDGTSEPQKEKQQHPTTTPFVHPRSPRSPTRPLYFPPPPHDHCAGFQTRYMNMMLHIDKIPRSHTILSTLFSWTLLLALFLAPGTFSPTSSPNKPLVGVTAALFGIGILGIAALALAWRRNYIWLLNRIYLPLILHALAGLVGALVMVAVQHAGRWCNAAYVAVAVEGAVLGVGVGAFLYIDLGLLGALRREHRRQTASGNVVDLVRAGKRPPFAPGSVV